MRYEVFEITYITKSNLGHKLERQKKTVKPHIFPKVNRIQLIKEYKDFHHSAFSNKCPELELASIYVCECVFELKSLKININVKRP